MPEFVLRWKVPTTYLVTDGEIEAVRQQALAMANEIESAVSLIFFGWTVGYEVREFSRDTKNQSDFTVTGWVTDNDDEFVEKAELAQAAILVIMRKHARGQSVDCWFQRVKGKWGGIDNQGQPL